MEERVGSRVVAVANGWNEARNLPLSLRSTNEQKRIKLQARVYVDDGSVDGSADIAEDLGWDVIRLKWTHKCLVETPWISHIINLGLERIYEATPEFDYLLIAPCDAVLHPLYIRSLVYKMRGDRKVKVASGIIYGEPAVPTSPRGAGRLYDGKFFINYVKFFPETVIWETWALLRAFSLGYKCRVYDNNDNFVMKPLRPTRNWKPTYGYAMKHLHYFPPFALARCLMHFIGKPEAGVKALAHYFRLGQSSDVVDQRIKDYIRYTQSRRLIKVFEPPKLFRGHR